MQFALDGPFDAAEPPSDLLVWPDGFALAVLHLGDPLGNRVAQHRCFSKEPTKLTADCSAFSSIKAGGSNKFSVKVSGEHVRLRLTG
jgi:hypothetical protein